MFVYSPSALLRTLISGVSVAVVLATTTACLERPIGRAQPRTTNLVIDQLVQSGIDEVDLLFVVDNSPSMADKQDILALALPDLVGRFVNPRCVDARGRDTGTTPDTSNAPCPEGVREFRAIDDVHVAVITSSLGGYGAVADCVKDPARDESAQAVDMAHLLGTLPRGAAAAPSAAADGFLSWSAGVDGPSFLAEFADLVRAAGEFGCGWEAPLEAWYRFLVDPYPYTKIVRRPCSAEDTANSCAGPETDADGDLLIDQTVLDQRAAFLRPDSLLAIIMLSDENDCSFQASGQMWRLSQTVDESDGFVPAFKGTAACSDPAMGPNHECCHSCGQRNVADGCPSVTLDDGSIVGVGCEDGRRHGLDARSDQPNLRCFQQKRRFGVDYLYPVARYTNALTQDYLCPFEGDLTTDPESFARCRDGSLPVPNPLFRDLAYERRASADPDFVGVPSPPRPKNLIYLAGIVGVPWQDVAVSSDPEEALVYRSNGETFTALPIDWSWLIGEGGGAVNGGIPVPDDPLMVESIEPRTGANPATGEPLAEPGAGFVANSINGHEWNIADNSDLQYACIFPLMKNVECPSPEAYRDQVDGGAAAPSCDCTDYGGESFRNPLCQAPDGTFDRTQRYAKAYPSLRQLEVLHAYGWNSIVASICPKELTDTTAPDFGYRPAMAAIADRLVDRIDRKCASRELSLRRNADGQLEAACAIIETKQLDWDETASCDSTARKPVEPEVADMVRVQLEKTFQCGEAAGIDCDQFQVCEITQLSSDSCLNDELPRGDGWCYVDPAKGLGSPRLVEKCPATARRDLRFIGQGAPRNGTLTVVACSGAEFPN